MNKKNKIPKPMGCSQKIFRGKPASVKAFIKKDFNFKELEKEDKAKPKATRMKEIIKINMQIKQKVEKQQGESNKTKSWFSEKTD